jgi:hypothetical protein
VKQLQFYGLDNWDRPVYIDQTEQFWKDINLGRGIPCLHSASSNSFQGEPDMPIVGDYEIISRRLKQ